MTPHPQPPGELEYGSILSNGEDWRLRKYDAGMGETEYRIFKNEMFFAQFDNRKDAETVMTAMCCASHGSAQSEQEIRKDEREKVLELLNDLRRYANGEYIEADLSDNEHDMRIHLEYENRIWGIMQELRKGGVP
jgi:tellurite resistance protein